MDKIFIDKLYRNNITSSAQHSQSSKKLRLDQIKFSLDSANSILKISAKEKLRNILDQLKMGLKLCWLSLEISKHYTNMVEIWSWHGPKKYKLHRHWT